MDLGKFINILVVCISVIGVGFISIGAIAKARDVLDSTTHYSATSWPSKKIINNITDNKVKTVTGFVVVLIAGILQLVSLLLPNKMPFLKNPVAACLLALVTTTVILGVIYIAQKGIQEYYSTQIMKQATRDYMSRYKRWSHDSGNVQGVESINREYFNMGKEPEKSWQDYIKEVAKHVNWDIPDDLDLANIKEPLKIERQ